MKVIIDRFEGRYAIVELENQTMSDMPRELVPVNAQEGDVLEITINKVATQERERRIKKLMGELWEK